MITINIFFAIPPPTHATKMMDSRMGMGGMFGHGGKKGGGGYSAMEAMVMAGVMAKLMSSSGGSGLKLPSSGGQTKVVVPMPVIHMNAPVMGGYAMPMPMPMPVPMGGGYGTAMGGGHGMGMGGGHGMGMGGGYGMSMGMGSSVWTMS